MEIKIGDVFTTRVSNVTGVVKSIEPKPFGTVLLLDVNGQDRYTTV
jgi:hypothetical protein